ncbi:MAG: hypothetical protein NTV74_07495 [Euryarchaeota archaeon]|nr:hypothetical protein [Euryarchaeota archaeon]
MKKQLSTVGIVFLLFFFSFIAILSQHAAASGWINVTSPSIGQTYYEGGTYYITWSSFDAGNYVKIELYGGGSYYTIMANTSNDGSYQWTISSVPYSGSYQIIITSLSSSVNAVSDGFYIYKRTITITHPPAGEIWYGGDTHRINWNSENAGEYVEIYCITGSTTYTVTANTYNSGIYEWVVSSDIPSGSSYRIKIVSVSYSNVYDYSDYFSISRRYVKITSPTQGDTWYKGETYAITWNSENAGDYVTIGCEIGNVYNSINSNTLNDGSYSWIIPSSLSSSSSCQILIQSIAYGSIYDYSGYFSINERKITVNSPYAGDTWYKGETYTITWTSVNAGNYVSIELYEDGSYYSPSIISNTSNDGSYSWQIPTDLASSSSCKIKIKSLVYSNLYGISEYFSIDNRSITVTSPSEDYTWYKGDRYTITWDSKGSGDYVNIELYKDGLYHSSIATNVINNGDYLWKIPSDLSPGSYQIKITSTTYSSVSAYSSGYVKIDDTLLQKSLGPVVIIIVLAIILSVIFITLNKRRKRKIAKPEEDKEGDVSDSPTPVNIKREIKAEKISDDEYEQIWEKNKHK